MGVVLADAVIFWIVGAVGVVEGIRLNVVTDPNVLRQALAPGYYVIALGVALVVTGTLHFARHRHSGETQDAISADMRLLVGKIALLLGAYTYAIDLLGYSAASFPFFLLLFRIFGVRSWLSCVALAATFTAICYVVFVRYCEVAFPHGSLFS